jgi:DNA-directed RNA polymerase specialized sigma24 family protein
MVIGNGFFSDTKEDALREMTARSKCEVKPLPFPTIGNLTYYISRTGDLYGQQRIQGKCLTRQRKHVKYSPGFKARLSTAPHKEVNIYVQVLIYCAFVLNRWEPDIELEAINGNVYDVRPENFRPKEKPIPKEWSMTMEKRKKVYTAYFMHVAWSVNYVTQLDIQDCKDATQTAFIYLCTDGYMGHQRETQDFVGLWIRVARFRAIDRLKHQQDRQVYDTVDLLAGSMNNGYEFDIFSLLPGEKMQLYTRLYYEGNTPTEIAQMYNVHIGTVSSAVTRSVAYLRDYYQKDIERWNHC